jgi:hypothetical protein
MILQKAWKTLRDKGVARDLLELLGRDSPLALDREVALFRALVGFGVVLVLELFFGLGFELFFGLGFELFFGLGFELFFGLGFELFFVLGLDRAGAFFWPLAVFGLAFGPPLVFLLAIVLDLGDDCHSDMMDCIEKAFHGIHGGE